MIIKTTSKSYHDVRCKICDDKTHILGVCDFNKTCEEEKKKKISSLIGVPIYYHQCDSCGFIFTVDLDDWSIDDYLENIYNDDYIKVDPDYLRRRPLDMLRWFTPLLGNNKDITILDYGAGSGVFGEELKKQGWPAESWDPMWKKEPLFGSNMFDVITSFEVFEHTPSPYGTLAEINNFLKPETGQIVFTTLVNDIIGDLGVNYWYLAPRNGHVCMHSNKSLDIMFDKLGMFVQHFSPSQHIASFKG